VADDEDAGREERHLLRVERSARHRERRIWQTAVIFNYAIFGCIDTEFSDASVIFRDLHKYLEKHDIKIGIILELLEGVLEYCRKKDEQYLKIWRPSASIAATRASTVAKSRSPLSAFRTASSRKGGRPLAAWARPAGCRFSRISNLKCKIQVNYQTTTYGQNIKI